MNMYYIVYNVSCLCQDHLRYNYCEMRKEVNMQKKVINTRISKDLYDKISAKAKKNRITVSNLIRNLVEDSLEIYGDVADLVDGRIKNHLHRQDTVAIIGYQSITLAKDAV